MQQLQNSLNGPVLPPLESGESPAANLAGLFSPNRLPASIEIQTVEVYPYIDYIKYLLAGSDLAVDLCDGDDRRWHYFHR